MKVCVVDWQVAYHGFGPTDLCYLIYSSSTKVMRDKYLDHFLELYYETLTELLDKLNVAFSHTFEEFHGEFVQSMPYCLLFCANADDFTPEPNQGKNTTSSSQDSKAQLDEGLEVNRKLFEK